MRDLGSEALAGMLARPVRAALTTVGTVLGIGALVATLGVSTSAGNRIVGRFDEMAATQVTVAAANQSFIASAAQQARPAILPWDAEVRLLHLNGVVAAGALGDADVGSSLVRSTAIHDPLGQTEFQMRVVGSSPGLLDALRGSLMTGRFFDDGSVQRQDRTVVLGANAARRLNIGRVDNQPAIYIGEDLFTVIGVLGSVQREPSLLGAVLVPWSTAADRYELSSPSKVVIETILGAAQLIAAQAPTALNPNSPEVLQVTAPPDPRVARRAVESDVNSLFLVLGVVSLMVGAVGIANVTLVTVMERTGEIGLRRALGAARRHIAAQFLLESTVIGLLGGVIGTSTGILVVVSVATAKQWTPVLQAWVPLAAPVLGGVVGLLAGLYPAVRAARLEPVEALRGAT